MSWRRVHAVRPRRPWVGFPPPTTPAPTARTPTALVSSSRALARRGLALLLRPPATAATQVSRAARPVLVGPVWQRHRPGQVAWARPPLAAPSSLPGGAQRCRTRVYLPQWSHRDGQVVWLRPGLPNPTPGPRLPRLIVASGHRLTHARHAVALVQRLLVPPPVVSSGTALALDALTVVEQLPGTVSAQEQLLATLWLED